MKTSAVSTVAGKVLLRKGNLRGALVIFDEAASMLSLKTTAGGQALLQKAITLDSMGSSEEALNIYRQLRTHRCLEVAKTVCKWPLLALILSYALPSPSTLLTTQMLHSCPNVDHTYTIITHWQSGLT